MTNQAHSHGTPHASAGNHKKKAPHGAFFSYPRHHIDVYVYARIITVLASNNIYEKDIVLGHQHTGQSEEGTQAVKEQSE
jgi:hypothetical protein